MDDLLQKDPLKQEFTPGITPLSAAPSPGLPGEEQGPEKGSHCDEASSCAVLAQCSLPSRKGTKLKYAISAVHRASIGRAIQTELGAQLLSNSVSAFLVSNHTLSLAGWPLPP